MLGVDRLDMIKGIPQARRVLRRVLRYRVLLLLSRLGACEGAAGRLHMAGHLPQAPTPVPALTQPTPPSTTTTAAQAEAAGF